MGDVHKYPQKPTSNFIFLRGQATLYNIGFWFYRQNMLAFHFIDSNHVGFPLYRLQSCGHSNLYKAILDKVGRKASSELYMGDGESKNC